MWLGAKGRSHTRNDSLEQVFVENGQNLINFSLVSCVALCSSPVVLNQGAAESSRGAANFQTWRVFTSKLHKRVWDNDKLFEKLKKGAANKKKVENHCLTWLITREVRVKWP